MLGDGNGFVYISLKTVVIIGECVVYILSAPAWECQSGAAVYTFSWIESALRLVFFFVLFCCRSACECVGRAPTTCNRRCTLPMHAHRINRVARLFIRMGFWYACLYVWVYSFTAIGCSLRFFETTKEYIDCKCCTQRQPMSSLTVCVSYSLTPSHEMPRELVKYVNI